MLNWLKKIFGSGEESPMSLIADCVRLAEELGHIEESDSKVTAIIEDIEESLRGLTKFVGENDPTQINYELASIAADLRKSRRFRHDKFSELKVTFQKLKKLLQS